MHEKAMYATSVADLHKSFEFLLLALKDRQGRFYNPLNATTIAHYPGQESIPSPNPVAGTHTTFEYQILNDGIRYLKMVSISSEANVQKEAEVIRAAIDSLSKDDSPYWIVDLRYVSGGNITPMLAGLGPLLGQGMVATIVDGKKKVQNIYAIHNGKFYDNLQVVINFPTSVKDMRESKVAVLTSKHTSGAGELLAITLKGRKNTKFFGEQTAGQINGTNTIQITKDLVMSLSEKQYLDRKGNVYKYCVRPDTAVPLEHNVELTHDKAVTEAILWMTTTTLSENTLTKVTVN
jgi:C-terminal processing protease CtpA/Prc